MRSEMIGLEHSVTLLGQPGEQVRQLILPGGTPSVVTDPPLRSAKPVASNRSSTLLLLRSSASR